MSDELNNPNPDEAQAPGSQEQATEVNTNPELEGKEDGELLGDDDDHVFTARILPHVREVQAVTKADGLMGHGPDRATAIAAIEKQRAKSQ